MLKSILRIIIALIFIASGFVKAVDAVGFSFKMEEYFSPSVFNMPFFEGIALPIAVFVVALELVLGFLLLLNISVKKVLLALIALCVFFAFLTFYSAYFNKVTDCGCFGDAIKFTPWQSFFKDIILLFGLIVLWFLYRKDSGSQSNFIQKAVLGILMIASAVVIFIGISKEPVIDFRDYKIGTNLNSEKEKIAKDPDEYKTFYVLKNKKTGEEKEVNQDVYVNDKQYWQDGTPWEIQSDKIISKLVKEGYSSEISKFKLEDADGIEITEEVLKAPKAVIIFCYNPQTADKTVLGKAEAKAVQEKGAYVLGVSPDLKIFKTIKTASMDATPIKTIARSNPFVLILENGKIEDKIPAKDFIKE
ncbi:MAG: DoxX family protein [Bergeyella sp.]